MKSDYEILGLPENAPKDVVDRKYGVLIKQYKARTDEHGVMDEDAKYYQTITEAYYRIKGIDPKNMDDNPTSVIPYSVRRFFGKIATLFEQYRLVWIIVVVVVGLGIMTIVQMNTVTVYDLNIKFIGSFDTLNEADFSMKISDKSEVSDSAAASFFTITTQSGYTPQNLTAATQFETQLIAGAIDVIFMDEEGWNSYKNDKAFYKLDDLLKEEKFLKLKDKIKVIDYEVTYDKEGRPNGPPSGIYAIDITETKYFDDFKDSCKLEWLYDEEAGQPKTLYVAICGTANNLETAKEFLYEILTYEPTETPIPESTSEATTEPTSTED
ncbi:MAG: hypothetical protein E7388_01405 [Ruminococcaceae bacterium]|nr:hypothetical protein [Oscillospiraceae bacterium]